jgi:hypothetical protein
MAKLNKINLSGTEILLEQLSSYIRILEPDENGNLDWANMEDGVWYLLPIGVRLGGYDNGTFSTSGFTDYNKNGIYYEAENQRLNTIRILCVNKYPPNVCYTKMIWFVPNASFSTADSWGMGIMVGKSEMGTYSDASLPNFDVTTGLIDVNCLLNSNHTVAGQWIFNDTTKIPKLGANAVPSNADHITNKAYVDLGDLLNASNNTYILSAAIRYDMGLNYTDSDTIAAIQAIMDDYYPKYKANGNQAALIFGKDYTGASNGCDIVLRGVGTKFYYVYPYRGDIGSYFDDWGKTGCLTVNGSWDASTSKFTVTSASISESVYTPTNNANPANKKYVDDKVAASKTVPKITIAASQIVSADPVIISMTTEQQGILEDSNQPCVLIDGTVLGLSPTYSYKTYDTSNNIYITGYSLGTNEDQSGNLYAERIGTILAVYDKTTKQMKATDADPCCNRAPVRGTALTNKNYVDTELAKKQEDLKIFPIEYEVNTNSSPMWYNSSSELGILYMAKINELYHKGIYQFVIRIIKTSNRRIYYDFYHKINPTSHTINSSALAVCPYLDFNGYIDKVYSGQAIYSGLSYDAENDEFVHSGYVVATFVEDRPYPLVGEVLRKTNTTAYTPTQQYHPATKGYVDSYINSPTFIDNLPLVLCDYAGVISEYDSSETYYRGNLVKGNGLIWCAYIDSPGDLDSGDWWSVDPLFYTKCKVFKCSPWNYSVTFSGSAINRRKITQYECKDYAIDSIIGEMLNYAIQNANSISIDSMDPLICIADYPYKDEISGSTVWNLQQDSDNNYYFDCGNSTTITWKQSDVTPENYWVRITRNEAFQQ